MTALMCARKNVGVMQVRLKAGADCKLSWSVPFGASGLTWAHVQGLHSGQA